MANNSVKKRYWAFVAYPESLPENWRDMLTQTGLPCAVSPLHEFDVDPTGQPKKPHYHIILAYSGPTTFNSVKKLVDTFNAPIPQPLESVRGMYRYLTHKDNPEKYQYDEKDITLINNFSIIDFVELTKHEVLEIKLKIHKLIRTANIFEYSDLMDILLDSGMMTEYDVASSNTIFFDRIISSRRNGQLSKTAAEAIEKLSDPEYDPFSDPGSDSLSGAADPGSDPSSGAADPDSDPSFGAADPDSDPLSGAADFLPSNSEGEG